VITYTPEGTMGGGINVLGLITFCLVFGAVLGQMGEQGRLLIQVFECLNNASIMMINLVMK
jgi:solute carrier family 1 (high affinity glutamate transporter) protein 1